MFGYVTAFPDKMSEEDRKTYQGYYCGLCSALGEKYGLPGKLVLTYDMVFLALLQNALTEEPERSESAFCLHKGKRTERIHAEALSFAADMTVLLAFHNLSDKVYDSKDKKAAVLRSLLKSAHKKAARQYPEKEAALLSYTKALRQIESENDENPDAGANLTGEMVSSVFTEKEDEFSKYLRPMFYYLGKFIYLADAWDDLEDDLMCGQYNPYSSLSGDPALMEKVRNHLELVLGECASYFEMLPIFRHREILRNILYAGVWMHFAKTAEERKNEEKDSKRLNDVL